MFSMKITGAERVKSKFTKAPKEVKTAARKATRQGAKMVLAATVPLVPVRSGALKRSLKVRAIKQKKNLIGAKLTVQAKDSNKMRYIGPMEYGWTSKGGRAIPGKHFLKDGKESTKQAVLDYVTSQLLAAIRGATR